MATAARHAATVTKGQVVFDDSTAWRVAVARNEGHRVWVSQTRQATARTLSQNSLYWVWCHELAEYIGDSDKSVHEYLKTKFLPARDAELLDGKHLTLPPSTRLLTVDQFRNYMDSVQTWAATFLGVVLPDGDQIGEGL